MNNALKNWKTTSAGLIISIQAVVHLIFEIHSGNANENSWMIAVTSIFGGVGLIFAGDSSNSTIKK